MKFLKSAGSVLLCLLLVGVLLLPLGVSAETTTAFESKMEDFGSQWPTHDGFKIEARDASAGSGKAAVFTKGSGELYSSGIDLSGYKSAKLSFELAATKTLVDDSNNLTVTLFAGGKKAKVWSLTGNKAKINDTSTAFTAFSTGDFAADFLKSGVYLQIEATASAEGFRVALDNIKITGTPKSTSSGTTSGSTVTAVSLTLPTPSANTKQSDLSVTPGKNVTVTSLSWSGDTLEGKFQGGKTYYATIVVSPAAGYTFSDTATKVTVYEKGTRVTSGTVSAPKITPNSLTVTVTYEIAQTPTTISRLSASNVTRSSATLTLDYSGSYTVESCGFYWGSSSAVLDHVETLEDGKKSLTLSSLSGGTMYYFKAYVVTTEGGEVNSSTKSFQTLQGLSVTVSASAGGTASPLGVNEVENGDAFTVTVTPDSGYAVNFITVDGKDAVLQGSTYTFTGIDADHTFYVAFKPVVTSSKTEETENRSSGGNTFIKVLIILLCVILLAAVLFLLAKPADMPAGVALHNLWTNLKRSIMGRR